LFAPGWGLNNFAARCSVQSHADAMQVYGMTLENIRFPARNAKSFSAHFCAFSVVMDRKNISLPAWVRNPLPVPEGFKKVKKENNNKLSQRRYKR
jgi:hypothetical protein